MTEQELTLPTNNFDNGELEFKNVDQYKAIMKQYIDYGNNFVVTEETMKGAKKERAFIRNMVKASTSWRTNTKNEILKNFIPLDEEMKELEKQAKNSANNIDEQVKKFEEEEKDKLRQQLIVYIDSQYAEKYSANVEVDDKWLIKKNFSGNVPKDSLIEEIDKLIADDKNEQERRFNDEGIIKVFSETLSLNADTYIRFLDQYSVSEIIESMKFDSRMSQEREDARDEIARFEREQEIASSDEKQIDEETGEVIEKKQERFTRELRVFDCSIEELREIADFLNRKGIKFESISKEEQS